MNKKMVRFADLSKDEFRKLQLKQLEILDCFEDFCKKNGLRYFLTNGTCLGAVRHHGFIPWDDDTDVALPREDYERLFQLWDNRNNRFQLLRPGKTTLTGVHIGQLRDSSTTCIYDYATDYDICHGVKIDVEPIDGCPDGKIARWIQGFYCKVYALMAAQRVPHHASNFTKFAAKCILTLIPSGTVRYAIFSAAEMRVKKYKFEDCAKIRLHYGPVLDKEIYADAVNMEFEEKLRPVAKEYARYLTILYGDYMKFPPPEKRVPETEVLCFHLDKPYAQYKGILYCAGSRCTATTGNSRP